jgi:hypothetical protein
MVDESGYVRVTKLPISPAISNFAVEALIFRTGFICPATIGKWLHPCVFGY